MNSRCRRSVMRLCSVLCRRKKVDDPCSHTCLARVLDTFDLTALGIGSTLGVGIYVLAGDVSKSVAGPGVIISFFFAAMASLFAGLCYAEFGSRVPRAGSAYIYSYYSVGELVAFIIGWCLILEYVIGAASVARGISTYIDCLFSGKIKGIFMGLAPMEATFMSPYVDFFSFALCIILACALASGVRESTSINNFLTLSNMALVCFIIVSGLFKIDFHNWQLDESELPGPEAGTGGFAPFGMLGIIKGAAICFYGFIGFDSIATTGEEVKDPQRAIPASILLSLTITFLAYFGVSAVLTLMWPYHQQDPDAPLPYVYSKFGWDIAKWLVSVGALFGLFSSLYGAMFPLPRIIYAMASDGLIFRVLGDVSPRTKTPVVGTIIAGIITATMSALFNLQQLISLMALGTLLVYTIVAVCVLILRYSPDFDEYKGLGETTALVSNGDNFGLKSFFANYFRWAADAPSVTSKVIVIVDIILYCTASFVLSMVLMRVERNENNWSSASLWFFCIFGAVMIVSFTSLSGQPKATKNFLFQMPFVPLLPCVSIFLNIYLMVYLDQTTWIKFVVWMCAGFIPYLCWYCWKFSHGQLGENSRYNINRINHIKFNEMVCKLMRDKETRLNGYLNETFVSDLEPNKPENSQTRPEPEIPKEESYKCVYDEIYVCNEIEKTVEVVEMNNNVFKMEEPDDERWRSVAEVHAVAAVEEDEDGESAEKSKVMDQVLPAGEELSPPGKESNVVDEGIRKRLHDDLKEKIFGPEIPIRRQINRKPIIRLNIEQNDSVVNNGKIKRGSNLISSEMREKLNKILQEQSSSIRVRMAKPVAVVTNEKNDSYQSDSNHLDIKTLTKAEIKNKLQHLLKNGPPNMPHFRNIVTVQKELDNDKN